MSKCRSAFEVLSKCPSAVGVLSKYFRSGEVLSKCRRLARLGAVWHGSPQRFQESMNSGCIIKVGLAAIIATGGFLRFLFSHSIFLRVREATRVGNDAPWMPLPQVHVVLFGSI